MPAVRNLKIAVPVMVVLLGLVAYQYGYLRVRSEMQSVREEQDAAELTLKKYISFIAKKPLLSRELADLRTRRAAYESMLVQGATSSIAAAALQKVIKEIVTARGGAISSERMLPVEDFGTLKRITVSIDSVVPDPNVLTDILYAIETHTPYLVVREVDVRLMNFGKPGDLQVKLDVSALGSGK